MKSIDRPLCAGLLAGFTLCFAISSLMCQSACADDGDENERQFAQVEEDVEIEIEYTALNKEEADEDDEREEGTQIDRRREQMRRQFMERGRFGRGGERGGGFPGFGGPRGPEAREKMERAREQEMKARDMEERERDEMRRREEIERREHMERQELERYEREAHAREHEHERREQEIHHRRQAMEIEMLEVELRRKQVELRLVEMELEERSREFDAESHEAASDAIKLATEFMKPPAVADFLSDLIKHTESPSTRRQLRLRIAIALFQSDQPDRAADHLGHLIRGEH